MFRLISVLAALLVAANAISTGPSSCDIDICFALENSDAISPQFFRDQQDLVYNLVGRLQGRAGNVGLAAYQFSTSAKLLSPLTSDIDTFLEDVSQAQDEDTAGTFVASALNVCFKMLLGSTKRRTAIIVMGNGRNTIGSDPGRRSELFTQGRGNSLRIFSIGFGYKQDFQGLRSIASARNNAFSVNPNTPVWRLGLPLTVALCDRV